MSSIGQTKLQLHRELVGFAVFILLPASVFAINTIGYPKYGSAEEALTDVNSCTAGNSLSTARGVCTNADQLIQANACDCFSCANPDNIEYTVSGYPQLQLCDQGDESFYLSRKDFVSDADLVTYLDVTTRDNTPSPVHGDRYVGCITKELFEFLRQDDPASSTSTVSASTGDTSTPGTTLTDGSATTDQSLETTSNQDSRNYPGLANKASPALLRSVASGGGLYALYFDPFDNDLQTAFLRTGEDDDLDIRLWDLGDGCHENWHPVNTDGGPVGHGVAAYSYENEVQKRSAAVYCVDDPLNEEAPCADRIRVSYVQERYEEQETFFPVDNFYKRSICLLRSTTVEREGVVRNFTLTGDEVLTGESCISACQGNGDQAAVVSPTTCWCIADVAATLPLSTHVSYTSCWPCEDDGNDLQDPLECGNFDFDTGRQFHAVSLYFLDDAGAAIPDNHGFQYWQCVKNDLYNAPEEVLPEGFYSSYRYDGAAEECLASCDAEDFNVAMVRNVNVSDDQLLPHTYDCYCLSERYLFRSTDIDFNCLNFWCPSVEGPCLAGGQGGRAEDAYMAAVYCRGDSACSTDIMMDDRTSGICEQYGVDFKVSDVRLGVKEYLQCVHNATNDRWSWELGACQGEDEIFDRNRNDCAVVVPGQFCQQTDSRGSEWRALLGDTAVKTCEEDLGEGATGNAFWYCDPNSAPLFATPEPDRSECQEPWVGDVEELIEDDAPAKDINEFILFNLETSEQPVSGGGLIDLSSQLEEITRLQASQLANGDGADEGEDAYAESAYGVVDSLLNSIQSWQEIMDDTERYQAASSLIRQVDAAGAVTIAEISAQQQNLDGCYTVSQKYQSYALLDVELVRDPNVATTDGDSDDDDSFSHFVFKSDGVEIRVPSAFIPDSDLGCGSLVAASLAVDFAATQMFPDAPPIPSPMDDGDDDEITQDGLNGVLVDFTSISGSLEANPVRTRDKAEYDDDVVIIYDHLRRRNRRPACAWWDFEALKWRTDGCTLDRRRSTGDSAVCRCEHLTNFAIIFGADDADDPLLSLLSIILGAISCACFIVTIVMSHLFGQNRHERRFLVTLNRNYCLMLGQLLFLSVVGAYDNLSALACTIVTAITHYVWISAFAWIGMEGYLLFIALVVVFDRGHHGKPWQFFLAGYGIPLVVAGITIISAVAVGDLYDGYFREDACWLDGGYLWAFIGPVAGVLVFNTIILIKALMEAYRINQQRNSGEEDEAWANTKLMLRNFLILSYTLGLTWAFGYFNTLGRPSQFIFVFLNASVGVLVLVQTIMLNKKLREASATIWRSRSASTRSTRVSADPSDQSATKRKVSKATSLNFDGKRLVSMKKRNGIK